MAATRTALVLAAALELGGWAAGAPAEAPRKLKADTAQEVLELKPNAEFTQKASAAIRQAIEAAKIKLAKAEEQAKTNPQAAIAALHDLHDEFVGTPLADAAAARAKAFERAAAGGPKPTEQAGEQEPPQEADPAAIRAQVRQWFALAENYVANGQTGQARLLMHKIITQPTPAPSTRSERRPSATNCAGRQTHAHGPKSQSANEKPEGEGEAARACLHAEPPGGAASCALIRGCLRRPPSASRTTEQGPLSGPGLLPRTIDHPRRPMAAGQNCQRSGVSVQAPRARPLAFATTTRHGVMLSVAKRLYQPGSSQWPLE